MLTVPDDRHHALAEEFLQFIDAPGFPCVGAKAAVNRGGMRFVVARDFRSGRDDLRIMPALLDIARRYRQDPIPFQSPPVTLAAMLTAAEAIAGDRDHLRVDFYGVGGKTWFGETCLFPGSGLDRFNPPELHLALGRLWAGRSAELICWSTGEQSRDGSMSPLTVAN